MNIIVTALALIISVSSAMAGTVDRRQVNSIWVDVASVNDWLQNENGTRPMPHWKKVAVYEIFGFTNDLCDCSIVIEGSDPVKVYVRNLPEKIKSAFTVPIAFQKQIQDAERRLDDASKFSMIPDGEEKWKGRIHYDDKAAVKRAQDKLDDLKYRYFSALTDAAPKAVDIAMKAGQFNNAEVWDFGKKPTI